MTKIMAPAAILIAGLMAAPAEAARCPAGQMYRVSLGVCASRAANLKWLNHASRESNAGDSEADAPKRHVVRAKPKAKAAVPVPVARVAPVAEPAAIAPAAKALAAKPPAAEPAAIVTSPAPAAEAAAPLPAAGAATQAPGAEPAAPQSKVARAATLKKKFPPKDDPVQALAPTDETILLDPLVEAPSPSQSQSPYGTVKGNLF